MIADMRCLNIQGNKNTKKHEIFWKVCARVIELKVHLRAREK